MKQRYTELGYRLTELLGSQAKIAEVWGISRQAVSKKLAGEAPITLADLEKAAAHRCIPIATFFAKRGTDGAALAAFHAMHMHAPEALDRIINAFHHNRKILRLLADAADKLVQEVEPELRRSDRIRAAGVAEDTKEEAQ